MQDTDLVGILIGAEIAATNPLPFELFKVAVGCWLLISSAHFLIGKTVSVCEGRMESTCMLGPTCAHLWLIPFAKDG